MRCNNLLIIIMVSSSLIRSPDVKRFTLTLVERNRSARDVSRFRFPSAWMRVVIRVETFCIGGQIINYSVVLYLCSII